MMTKEYVTWEQVEHFVKQVAARYEVLQFDGVFGLPRGGLVFAVMLSHRLKLPLLMAPTNKSLIVDDICDSGESLVHYIKNSSSENSNEARPIVCTMYCKPNKLGVVPDYYMLQKSDRWVVFPWEQL